VIHNYRKSFLCVCSKHSNDAVKLHRLLADNRMTSLMGLPAADVNRDQLMDGECLIQHVNAASLAVSPTSIPVQSQSEFTNIARRAVPLRQLSFLPIVYTALTFNHFNALRAINEMLISLIIKTML